MAAVAAAEENGELPAPKCMKPVSLQELFRCWALMGWTAFGGPVAHVGLFQKTFVEQRCWFNAEVFTELFAVCQCLPGPSSTQMSFALGTLKKGVLGGLMSGILFQYPGAVIMTVLGMTAHLWATDSVIRENPWLAGLVGGLSASGVALVASAAIGLWNKACAAPDAKVLCGAVCVILVYYAAELLGNKDIDGRRWMWIFPVLIILGGTFSVWWRGPLPVQAVVGDPQSETGMQGFGVGPITGLILILLVFLIFIAAYVSIGLLNYEGNEWLFWFSAFWRTGTVIWGGGHVVLAMLEYEMVASGWLESPLFFAGIALAQAMPGPLFNFSAYLGAALGFKLTGNIGGGIAGAALCWLGLFGPGVTLTFGMLPWWGRFRNNAWYKRALPGLNAAAIGLLLASLVQMAAAVRGPNTKPTGPIPREASTCIAIISFWAVHWLKLESKVITQIQAPIVVVLGGIAGIIAGVIRMK